MRLIAEKERKVQGGKICKLSFSTDHQRVFPQELKCELCFIKCSHVYVHVCHKSLKRQSLMREGDDGAIHSDFIYTSELLMMIMKGKK